MSYKKLKNYRDVINRDDFSFISNQKRIVNISELIQYEIRNPIGKEKLFRSTFDNYKSNYSSFVNGFAKKIPDLFKSEKYITEIFNNIIAILDLDISKREKVSGNYYTKFNKLFFRSLNLLYQGIKASFDPEIVSETNITKSQLIRFFLNKNEGIRKDYSFNTIGKHSFMNKITTLNKNELIVVERYLMKPSELNLRKFNGWYDFGKEKSPIRILSTKHTLRRNKLYYLFKVSEHDEYQRYLRIPPKKSKFKSVA
ncbi:MAG: hypothetical protein ACOCRX_01050 [Candidatus Woesearchaeota archaeon]